MSYCELHTHSSNSHDGMGNPTQALQIAKAYGQVAMARTEHGNMFSVVEMEQIADKLGMKAIAGCEIYYQPVYQRDVKASKKDKIEAMRTKRYHMTVLAMDRVGYRNLCEMLTIANRDTFYYFPIVTHQSLVAHHQGLIVLSGCMSSYLSQAILSLDEQTAIAHIEDMARTFTGRFYLEVQPIEVPPQEGEMQGPQEFINDSLLRYAEAYGLPIVATSDAHYPSPEYYESFLVAHAMRKHKDPIADYSQRYLHSEEEMRTAWVSMMGSDGQYFLDETVCIADRVHVRIGQPLQMPELVWTTEYDNTLKEECEKRLNRVLRHKQVGIDQEKIYRDALAKELKAYRVKNFSSYMLLGWQLAEYCQIHDIEMQARGSVCGSLVAYLLNISKIDPMVHGTIADRFFSEERTTSPDIDYDIQDDRREEVIAWLEGLYPNRSARIINFNKWKTRNLVNDLARHYAIGGMYKDMVVTQLENMGYNDNPVDFDTLMQNEALAEVEKEFPHFFKHFIALHGLMIHIGKHASGLVISHGPITDIMPLVKQPSNDKLLTSFDKDAIEYVGALKLDLLGVSALTAIHSAERAAKITFTEDDLLDPLLYTAMATGETMGIFQFSSHPARQMLRDGKPTSLKDIAALTALNRPVPIAEGSLAKWLQGRRGNADVTSILYNYTQDTYGALIYQEQVMRVCQELAGFTRGQTDKVLKMLKKYQQDNVELHLLFIEGCMKSGVTYQDADKLWGSLRRYLFCMAHAFSYAYLSVRQMNVKLKSPFAWYLSLLQQESDSNKQHAYCAEALQVKPITRRVYFLPAHVNGEINFSGEVLDGRDVIRFGLNSIDGVGPTVASAVYQERLDHGDYTSLDDLIARLPKRVLNSARVQRLQETGAVDFDALEIKTRTIALNKTLIKYSRYGR